jgi:hypothetical protein
MSLMSDDWAALKIMVYDYVGAPHYSAGIKCQDMRCPCTGDTLIYEEEFDAAQLETILRAHIDANPQPHDYPFDVIETVEL